MHSRNPLTSINFKALSATYPRLSHFIDKHGSLDFGNPEASYVLAEVICHHYFSLSVDIPRTNLCPAIPNRMDYLLFIEDLVALNGLKCPTILDIGTGPIAVFCVLGARWRPDFRFVGTEISHSSLSLARKTVALNALSNVSILDAPIGTIMPRMEFDILMCNPPFYASASEMEHSRHTKRPRLSHTQMQDNESVSMEGGETAFITRLVEESVSMNRSTIYTSLVGKKSSCNALDARCKQLNLRYRIHSIQQGNTRRWLLTWTTTESLVISGTPTARQLSIQRFERMSFCQGDMTISTAFNSWSRTARRGSPTLLKSRLTCRVYYLEHLIVLVEGGWDDFLSLCSHLRKSQSLSS